MSLHRKEYTFELEIEFLGSDIWKASAEQFGFISCGYGHSEEEAIADFKRLIKTTADRRTDGFIKVRSVEEYYQEAKQMYPTELNLTKLNKIIWDRIVSYDNYRNNCPHPDILKDYRNKTDGYSRFALELMNKEVERDMVD